MDAGRMQPADEGILVRIANGYSEGPWYSLYQYMTSPMNVRYVYAVIFIIANALAWGARENPLVFYRGQRGSCEDDLDCITVEVVLIVSFASCLFFSFMCISTMYTRSVHDRRNSWHTQWWLPKMILAAGCLMIAILAPAGVIEIYGRLAHLGAGIFLFIQIKCVIRYITRLNSRWCQANIENHYLEVNMVSILAYSASFIGIVYLFFKYSGCTVNVVLISSTLLFVYLMPLISQLTMARGCYMEPGLMGVYIVFLCWSAIKGEPHTSCNKKGKAGPSENWKIISFVVELFSIVVATFSTGSTDYKSIQFKNVESENDIPYKYGFFHCDFALGSMYFGMLFLGWDTYHASKKWSVDVNWIGTGIHIANEVLAVFFFVAIVLSRIYGTDGLRQFLGDLFGIGNQQHAIETDTTQPPALLPPTTEQHGDQSHATEMDSGRTPSSLPPTRGEATASHWGPLTPMNF